MSSQERFYQQNINTAIRNALKLGLLFAGVGVAGRSATGLYNLWRRNRQRPEPPELGPHVLDVPILREDEEKQANESIFQRYITEPIAKSFTEPNSPQAWPLSLPLAVLATGTGLYGGYRLADSIFDARRAKELEEELEAAKREYEEALTGKSALGRDLDKLYELVKEGQEKKANAKDTWGYILGTALTGLPLLALATGSLSYNMTRKRTPQQVLRQARIKRLRELAAKQPPPIYARPQPASNRAADVPNEDELSGEPLDKEAFDNPGPVQSAIPRKTPASAPPHSPDGPALGGASVQAINPVGPGSTSNHPASERARHDQGLLML